MRVVYYVSLVSVLATLGCGSSTSPTTLLNNSAPMPGSLVGWVILVRNYDTLVRPPYSGIRVSLENTDYSTTTDSFGYWRMDSVRSGSYDVRIAKDGFGLHMLYDVIVMGPGISSAVQGSSSGQPIRLTACATEPVTLDTAQVSINSMYGNSIRYVARSTSNRTDILFDTKPDVQPMDGHLPVNLGSGSLEVKNGIWTLAGNLPLSDLPFVGVHSGDTLYVSACADNGSGYLDRLGAIHLGSPGPKSNVRMVIVP